MVPESLRYSGGAHRRSGLQEAWTSRLSQASSSEIMSVKITRLRALALKFNRKIIVIIIGTSIIILSIFSQQYS